ncbi:hypothetical protein D019_3270 [Vibrio parahaemolyticus VP2007-095]|nr:hypothetical protein D019_3270 [Vibrio parahaemolyticus VP2007-095]
MSKKKKTPLKFPNPVNSNPSHDAEHVIYVAGTGGGKTSAVKHLGLVPKAAQAVFLTHIETTREQNSAVNNALKPILVWRSSKPW